MMDEKSLPVVPSSWEEGCGVVEKNNVRHICLIGFDLICLYHP